MKLVCEIKNSDEIFEPSAVWGAEIAWDGRGMGVGCNRGYFNRGMYG